MLAGEKVSSELQADRVEGAMEVQRQCGAAQLFEKYTTILRPIPDPQHIMHLLRVENQKVQPEHTHPHIHQHVRTYKQKKIRDSY